MKTICAWCEPNNHSPDVSHTICPTHFREVLTQVMASNPPDAQARYERRLKARQQMLRAPGAVRWPDPPAPASKPVLGWFWVTATATAALIGAWLWRVM